jgi:hypothetical protein
MALRFVPLKQLHVKQVVSQPRQNFKSPLAAREIELMVESGGEALVLDDHDSGPEGRAIACGGIGDAGFGIGRAWTLISTEIPKWAWPPLVKRMRAAMDEALASGRFHRISAETALDWPEGHRLLLALGMRFEGPLRGGLPGGLHAALYARVAADVSKLPVRAAAIIEVAERCLWEDTMHRPAPWLDPLRDRRAA